MTSCLRRWEDDVVARGGKERALASTRRDGLRRDDVGGMGLHIAARVMAQSGPGEILVSRTVVDLVTGSGLEFEDRGERELKGIPGSWQLSVAS